MPHVVCSHTRPYQSRHSTAPTTRDNILLFIHRDHTVLYCTAPHHTIHYVTQARTAPPTPTPPRPTASEAKPRIALHRIQIQQEKQRAVRKTPAESAFPFPFRSVPTSVPPSVPPPIPLRFPFLSFLPSVPSRPPNRPTTTTWLLRRPFSFHTTRRAPVILAPRLRTRLQWGWGSYMTKRRSVSARHHQYARNKSHLKNIKA